MQRVYRLLREARERRHDPVGVDCRRDARSSSESSTWDNPADLRPYGRVGPTAATSGTQQPARVEVWSEKGTVRGVLAPVLDEYGVGFRVMHGFSSATTVYDVAQDDDGRPLIVLYVGDFDPSGMFMSEARPPQAARQVRRRSREPEAHCADTGTHVGPAVLPRDRQEEGPAVQVVRQQLWQPLLGTRRDRPQRPPRYRAAGNRGRDRARGLGALRHRERGRAEVTAARAQQLESRER